MRSPSRRGRWTRISAAPNPGPGSVDTRLGRGSPQWRCSANSSTLRALGLGRGFSEPGRGRTSSARASLPRRRSARPHGAEGGLGFRLHQIRGPGSVDARLGRGFSEPGRVHIRPLGRLAAPQTGQDHVAGAGRPEWPGGTRMSHISRLKWEGDPDSPEIGQEHDRMYDTSRVAPEQFLEGLHCTNCRRHGPGHRNDRMFFDQIKSNGPRFSWNSSCSMEMADCAVSR